MHMGNAPERMSKQHAPQTADGIATLVAALAAGSSRRSPLLGCHRFPELLSLVRAEPEVDADAAASGRRRPLHVGNWEQHVAKGDHGAHRQLPAKVGVCCVVQRQLEAG